MEALDVHRPDLDSGNLLGAASRATGLSDFGDEAFRGGFSVLTNAIQREAPLSQFGRIGAKGAIVGILKNRLKLVEYGKNHPETAEQTIRRPIIIAGLPRTGTTALHGLLAQDPAHRTPMTWEVDSPAPPAEESAHETDPRIDLCQKRIDRFHKLVPGFNAIHPQGARLPQECQEIIAYNFSSIGFPVFLEIPSYEDWLLRYDFAGAFRWHRFFLQTLQSKFQRERWLLKSPNHIQYLPTLFDTYPDAAVIHTHRDPLQVIASLSSLTYIMRSVFQKQTNPHAVGRNQADFWERMLQRCLADRQQLTSQHKMILDVQFAELLSNPIGLVKRIYDFFDFELTEEALTRMQRFLTENKRDKYGRHKYTLEMFGLRAEDEAPRFRAYTETFDLPREQP